MRAPRRLTPLAAWVCGITLQGLVAYAQPAPATPPALPPPGTVIPGTVPLPVVPPTGSTPTPPGATTAQGTASVQGTATVQGATNVAPDSTVPAIGATGTAPVGTAPVGTAPAVTEPPVTAPAPTVLTPVQSRALVRYERGRQAYAAGRYRLAARELEAAYAIDPEGTNLLFNLGAVYERLGDVERAAAAYDGYLGHVDDAVERSRMQRILTRLRGARAELASLPRPHGRADTLFWATTGAALAGTALGVSWLATQQNSSAIEPAVGFTVGGVALGVLAAVLYFTREGPPRWPVPVVVTAQGGSAVGLGGVF